ncbi:MAG: PA14 domain-containing protein [Planctomycetota bacterium]
MSRRVRRWVWVILPLGALVALLGGVVSMLVDDPPARNRSAASPAGMATATDDDRLAASATNRADASRDADVADDPLEAPADEPGEGPGRVVAPDPTPAPGPPPPAADPGAGPTRPHVSAGDAAGSTSTSGSSDAGAAGSGSGKSAGSSTGTSATDSSGFQRPGVRDNLFSKRTRKLAPFSGSPPDATDDGPLGLLGSYLQPPDRMTNHGADFPSDDEYATLAVRFTRLDPQVEFGIGTGTDAFTEPGQPLPTRLLVRWDGYLNVRAAGEYSFFVGCTGLAELIIAGQRVYRAGTHVYYEDFVNVELPEGLLPFRMQWFHYRRDPQVQLRYYTPHDMAVLRSVASAPEDDQQIVTQAGDTPSSLATKFYGVADFADLLIAANPALVTPEQVIDPGTSLTVPPVPVERVPFAPVVVPAAFFRPPANAIPPTVESITPKKAAVGDEVLLRGRDFGNLAEIRVEFAGQPAMPVSGDATQLRVIVPIGAKTGPLVVRQGTSQSNALTFTCTTVFGVLAAWFDQSAESPGFVPAADAREPDDLHVSPIGWSSRSEIDSALRSAPFATRQTGRLGVPQSGLYQLTLAADEGARLTLDQVAICECGNGTASSMRELWLEAGYHALQLEAFDRGGAASLTLAWQRMDDPNGAPDAQPQPIRQELFFAPATGARPEITHVEWAGEFGAAEGEPLHVHLDNVTPGSTSVAAFVDGIAATATWNETAPGVLDVTVPVGVGMGQLTVRDNFVMSAPVAVPIANVGLLGRYYDFPESGFPDGWPPGFPQDRPISFMRQDRVVSFDGTGEFNLPFSETFGATWHGTIRITDAGVHRFWLGGDDGMAMVIGDPAAPLFVLDDGGALHPYKEINAEVELAPGEYPIALKFWENRGAEILRMFWQPPGATAREIVPRRVLRMPADWIARYHEWTTALGQEQQKTEPE